MKFSNTVRRREVVFMIRLLTIFGVVEQRQMRLLFDHMSNRSYGQILARLRQPTQYPIDQRLSHTRARGVRSFDCRR